MIRELAKQHEGKSQETSGHVFELHTPVLELGLRGATHALRVLSSLERLQNRHMIDWFYSDP